MSACAGVTKTTTPVAQVGLPSFPEEARVEKAEVVFHETFYDGRFVHPLHEERVLEVELP